MDILSLKGQDQVESAFLYSIIIPAYNEERLLPETLQNLQLAMQTVPGMGEIIVVDNNSTDATANIAKQSGARIVFEPFRQIAKARNSGAHAAQGRFFIFLDADTILPPQLLQKAIELLLTGSCCGGGTLLSFDTPLPPLANTLVKFWNWLSKTGKLAAGSFIFCLASGFHAINGFDEAIYAGEEVTFSRRLKAWGKQQNLLFTIIKEHPVVTSGRKFHWHSSLQLALLLVLFTLFPFGLRNRNFCSFWYKRPEQ